MTSKMKTLLTATFLFAIPLSGWTLYRANINLSGKCESLGRTLTVAEKRSKLVGFLQVDNAPANAKGRSSIVQTIFKISEKNYPSINDFSVLIHNIPNEDTQDFWIYPDFPAYAVEPHRYYDGGVVWEPVPFWYRVTGYANDLVFLDLGMTGTFNEGRVIQKKYDYRTWVNSCGEQVSLPNEYEVG